MKNQDLWNLNFDNILRYPAGYSVKHYFEQETVQCKGFCTACDKIAIGNLKVIRNDDDVQISHAADTDDYIDWFGSLDSPKLSASRVMIILENPSLPNYESGKTVYKGKSRFLPDDFYYWAPSVQEWPRSLQAVLQNHREEKAGFYGNYFAYLIHHFGLQNCYITNMTKCKNNSSEKNDATQNYSTKYWKMLEQCTTKYLRKEFKLFSPSHVVLCGNDVERNWNSLSFRGKDDVKICKIYHPAAVQGRSQTLGKTQLDMLKENDEKLKAFLKDAKI